MIEGLLLGIMVGAALSFLDFPYPIALACIAGLTNIVPYLGPVLGALPGLLIAMFDPTIGIHVNSVFLAYLIPNLIDMTFIFPVIVAKLVNLHPLLLLVSVILGQNYAGVAGMLLSIPLATILKIVLQEIYRSSINMKKFRLSELNSIFFLIQKM